MFHIYRDIAVLAMLKLETKFTGFEKWFIKWKQKLFFLTKTKNKTKKTTKKQRFRFPYLGQTLVNYCFPFSLPLRHGWCQLVCLSSQTLRQSSHKSDNHADIPPRDRYKLSRKIFCSLKYQLTFMIQTMIDPTTTHLI